MSTLRKRRRLVTWTRFVIRVADMRPGGTIHNKADFRGYARAERAWDRAILMGCAWGRGIATDADPDACPAKAVQVVVVHGGPAGPVAFRLCGRHRDFVFTQTSERVGEGA